MFFPAFGIAADQLALFEEGQGRVDHAGAGAVGAVEQAFDAEPAYYDLEQPEAYKLTYEESLNYEFYYDSDPEIGYIIDAVYDGTLDEDLALMIAKKEYVIAVLTSLFEENIYIYENGSVEYEENQPVLDTAVYTAYLDFSAKTISLYTDNGETLVQTVGMD